MIVFNIFKFNYYKVFLNCFFKLKKIILVIDLNLIDKINLSY